MAKILKIDACVSCPYNINDCCHHDYIDCVMKIKDDNVIPGWCPLPDTSQPAVEADAKKCVHPQGYIKAVRICGLCGEQM